MKGCRKELTCILPGVQATLRFFHQRFKLQLRGFTICQKFVNQLKGSSVVICLKASVNLRKNMCPFILVFLLLTACKLMNHSVFATHKKKIRRA